MRSRGVRVTFVEGGHTGVRRDSEGLHSIPWTWPSNGVIQTDCGDDYNSNSLKLKNALMLEMNLLEPAPDYFFIVDDDTFVHPRRWLAHEPQGDFECRLFHPQTPKEHKLNYGRPWAHGGGGWYMSRRMCELYVEKVTQRCSYDDVLAARVAQDSGIEIVDRPDLYGGDRYSGNEGQRVAADNHLVTCHHIQPNEMVKLWEATRAL